MFDSKRTYIKIHNLKYPLHKPIFDNSIILSFAVATFVQPSPYLLEYMESTWKKESIMRIIGETLVKLVTFIRHCN